MEKSENCKGKDIPENVLDGSNASLIKIWAMHHIKVYVNVFFISWRKQKT